jgi:hypothetical protein
VFLLPRFLLFFLPVFAFATLSASAQVINEFQASNSQTIADEDGEYEDWIEIYNETSSPINLGGYGLSDDYSRPFRWIFPDIMIQPGEFLIVWASGKNRTIPGSQLHANFKISASGEELLITDPNGIRVDEIPPLNLPTDISYGRQPNGSGHFQYFDNPTPGSSNTTPGFDGIASPPQFSHEGGLYSEPFSLSMEAGSGTTIRYSTSSLLPTTNTGFVYNSPVSVSNSGVIRAVAFKDNYIPSEPTTLQFVRMHSDVQEFNSDIPLIVMNQYQYEVVPGPRVPVSLYFLEGNSGTRTSLSGDLALQSRAKANYRGSSSLNYPKRMYGFHLLDEMDGNRSEELFGMPPDHNWIINAPYSDKSLMRNVVSYGLAESLGWYAPRTRFVEMFVHTGSGPLTMSNYHGVYVLVERIKWSDDRVNITKIGPGDNAEPEISGGYIIKKDRLNPGQTGFTTNRGTTLAFARPQEEDATPEQISWIRQYMSDFESALFSESFGDPAEGYQAFIDTDSFIDHFIITELVKEIDGYRLSTYMYKDRNAKLVMGPVWDFNLSLGNANFIEGWIPEGWYIDALTISNDCEDFIGCGVRDWYLRLLQDPNFVERLQYRWWELRQDILSNETLSQVINDNKQELNESQARNFDRWPVLGEYVWPNYFIANTWEEELEWMENFLLTRANWIDTQMGEEPDFEDFSIHSFWYFDTGMPNNTPLEFLEATYQQDGHAYMEFQSALSGYPYNSGHPNWRKASMERRNQPTSINYSEEANNGNPYNAGNMRGMQIRQPFTGDGGENTLIFHLDTEFYKGLRFSFAAKDEGAADRLSIDYSVSSGEPEWITNGLNQTVYSLSSSYQLFSLDFTHIQSVDFNADFKIRVRFEGDDMSEDAGDRVTFNNIKLEYIEKDTSASSGPAPEVPDTFELKQNYPNPFNPVTTISFSLPQSAHTELVIYNMAGQRVSLPVSGVMNAGTHHVSFDASNLSSGVYLYRLTSGTHSQTRKFMLIK